MEEKPEKTLREKLETKLQQYLNAKKQYEALVFINDGAAQAIQNLLKELDEENKKV
jgi:hypothetical protein